MIVIDASSILEILACSEAGERIREAVRAVELHAPHLIDLEISSAIRKWERSGDIDAGEGLRLLDVFQEMSIIRHPHIHLLPEIWRLRHYLTAYDAAYLALARSLNAPLLTMDEGLKRASRRPVRKS